MGSRGWRLNLGCAEAEEVVRSRKMETVSWTAAVDNLLAVVLHTLMAVLHAPMVAAHSLRKMAHKLSVVVAMFQLRICCLLREVASQDLPLLRY
jgi:hypothetical protein